MKKVFLPAIMFLTLIASCKKDDAPAPQNLLDKVVTKIGTDSLVTTYTYNAQNRLMGEVQNDPANSETYTTALNRDNNGRVSKVTYSTVGTTNPGSIGVDFFYLGATDQKLRNGKSFFVVSGVTINDSMAYEYNGTQVTKTNHYYSTTTVPYTLIGYYAYTYDARNNITSVKYYEVDAPGSSNFQLLLTYTYVYDDKVNPILSKDDALMEFNGSQYISPNNVVSGSYTSVRTPADNYTFTTTYEYRSDGRPTKSTTTGGGVTLVNTYSYK
jgi:hypothetical protein